MTDVEKFPATRSGRRGRPFTRVAALAWTAVTVIGAIALPGARPAAADNLSSAKAQAAAVEQQLQADRTKLDETGAQYAQAEQQVQQLQQEQATLQVQISTTKGQVSTDQLALRQQALQAYMSGSSGAGTGISSLFSGNGERASATAEYNAVADGNLGGAIDRLHRAQTLLGSQQQSLTTDQQKAQQALAAAEQAQQQAQAAEQAQQATLAGLDSQIASLVAQQQAAQQAAQHAAFLAAQQRAAQQQATANNTSGGGYQGGGGPVGNLPAAGGAATAVAAAKSQLGVPYVWGGETPGVGFDCSGLTQWAWRQAGVSLPRTAAAQYYAIPHVPLSDLQPGDLVFWNDGTSSIQHVGMYVGGGEVIHAPYTGTVVQYTPIWNNGLVGAGRP